jgi:hypothetical protein
MNKDNYDRAESRKDTCGGYDVWKAITNSAGVPRNLIA